MSIQDKIDMYLNERNDKITFYFKNENDRDFFVGDMLEVINVEHKKMYEKSGKYYVDYNISDIPSDVDMQDVIDLANDFDGKKK